MLTFYLLLISPNCLVIKIQHQFRMQLTQSSTTFVIPQSQFQLPNRFLTSNQHVLTNLVKFIENNSDLGVKKSPPRLQPKDPF